MQDPALDPQRSDPFELYRQVFVDKNRWQILCAVQALLLAGMLAATVVLALRPPTVVVKDRQHAEPVQLTTAGSAPPITCADARAFFINMLRLRFAWSSPTAARDLEQFLAQSYGEYREQQLAHFQAPLCADGQSGEDCPSRLQAWTQAGIQNRLLLPDSLEAVHCSQRQAMWSCHLHGGVLTQPLHPPLGTPIPPHRALFVAALLEVPHTLGTPYGLVVGDLRQLEPPAAPLPAAPSAQSPAASANEKESAP